MVLYSSLPAGLKVINAVRRRLTVRATIAMELHYNLLFIPQYFCRLDDWKQQHRLNSWLVSMETDWKRTFA